MHTERNDWETGEREVVEGGVGRQQVRARNCAPPFVPGQAVDAQTPCNIHETHLKPKANTNPNDDRNL